MAVGGVASSGVTEPGELALTRTGDAHERVSEIQRTRILAAMAEVCAQRGVANVTVAHVVARSGVSRRTFYELFGDREACFLAAFDDAIARVSHYVLDGYDPKAKWAERVRTALLGVLAFLDAEPDCGRLMIVGSLGAGASALERRAAVLGRVIEFVEEGRQVTAASQPPPLAAEGVVGGALSVLHARLHGPDTGKMTELAGPLTAMIVLPYLGQAAARRELARPTSSPRAPARQTSADPLRDLDMRLTYRTMRALAAVAASPGCSNREVGALAGMDDQGQVSKLLSRLARLRLIENDLTVTGRGAPNAWVLTPKGAEIERALGGAGKRRPLETAERSASRG
jgi:AcrR family transcriptional regulator